MSSLDTETSERVAKGQFFHKLEGALRAQPERKQAGERQRKAR